MPSTGTKIPFSLKAGKFTSRSQSTSLRLSSTLALHLPTTTERLPRILPGSWTVFDTSLIFWTLREWTHYKSQVRSLMEDGVLAPSMVLLSPVVPRSPEPGSRLWLTESYWRCYMGLPISSAAWRGRHKHHVQGAQDEAPITSRAASQHIGTAIPLYLSGPQHWPPSSCSLCKDETLPSLLHTMLQPAVEHLGEPNWPVPHHFSTGLQINNKCLAASWTLLNRISQDCTSLDIFHCNR